MGCVGLNGPPWPTSQASISDPAPLRLCGRKHRQAWNIGAYRHAFQSRSQTGKHGFTAMRNRLIRDDSACRKLRHASHSDSLLPRVKLPAPRCPCGGVDREPDEDVSGSRRRRTRRVQRLGRRALCRKEGRVGLPIGRGRSERREQCGRRSLVKVPPTGRRSPSRGPCLEVTGSNLDPLPAISASV